MKYCPKDKSHKNPAEAVFCCECGSRLVEVADNKICPKCGMSNPNEAIFCRECGTKLPDANGNVELTVYSSEICDRILAVGTNSYQTNTSKSVLKVPARKSVDILLQCGGKPFRITADLTKSNTLNVNWGTIEIQCKDCCQVGITGRNMDVPLIKQNASKEVIKVPYGVYTLKFELDGETEEMTVDVHGKIKVESHLQRKYKLIINSDVKIDRLTIDNGNAIVVQSNKFLWRNTQGTYTFRVHATDIDTHRSGLYEIKITLDQDTIIDLKWCHINVKTNGQTTAKFKQEGANCQTKITHNGSFSLLAVRGTKYELQLTKPHGDIHKEIITPVKEKLDVIRNWSDVTIHFDRDYYKGHDCSYYLSPIFKTEPPISCVGGFIQIREVTLLDLLHGEYTFDYGISKRTFESYNKYKRANERITITNNVHLSRSIPTAYNDRAKWNWLRTLICWVLVCMYGYFSVSCVVPFIHGIKKIIYNDYSVIPIIVSAIQLSIMVIQFILLMKNDDQYIIKNLIKFIKLTFVLLLILNTVINFGMILAIDTFSWNSDFFTMIYENEYNYKNFSTLLLRPTALQSLALSMFYFAMLWILTSVAFKTRIKGWSIIETID